MGDGPPCFQRDFTCPAVLRIHFRDNEISITGLLPSLACLSRLLHLFHCFVTPYKVSYNPEKHAFRFGLFPVSLAATQGIAFAFSSSGYLDVSVPRVRFTKSILFNSVIPYPPHSQPDHSGYERNGEGGFPHSEIVGSKFAHNSPTLIAACHVLHRLYMPRHPPDALTSRLRIHTINDNPA